MTKDRPDQLRLGFYCDRWPTFAGMHGPARYVQTLARGLVARGMTVHVLTSHRGKPQDFLEDGYHVHSRPLSPFPLVSRFQPGIGESYHLWRGIEALHARHPFSLIEFTNVEGVGFWTARASRIPTVVRIHTTAFDAVRLGTGNIDLERGYARLERLTARRATRLVTHTESHRRQAANDYGVPTDSITVVPHGFSPARPDRPVVRDPLQVLTVGAASQRKGVGEYLRAAAVLAQRVPGIHFVWAGADTPTAPGGSTWAAHAAREFPALKGRLEFRSNLSDTAIASLYHESGCYLSTSRYESFGMTMVEAMFAGLPVIAPATGAMGEVIQPGRTGWLFEPGNMEDLVGTVAHVIGDSIARAGVVDSAAAVAHREYSADVMTTRMLELYRAIV